MSSALYSLNRPAPIAEVLDAGFRIFRGTLLQTLPYGLLAMLAGKLPHLYGLLGPERTAQSSVTDPRWWVLDLVAALLVLWFIAAILERQVDYAAGVTPHFRQDLSSALQRTPTAALVLMLFLLAMGVCLAPLLIAPRAHFTLLATVLALPVLYLAVISPNATLAAIIGGRSVLQGCRHGWQLMRGHWWRTFVIYLVGVAVLAVLGALAGVLAGLIIALAGNANLAMMTALSAEVAAAVAAVALPFYAALALSVYRDLEARRALRLATQGSVLLLLLVLPWAAAPADAGPANTLIDACVSQLDAQTDVGYARIAARCPELVRQLRTGYWAAWLPARWQEPNNDLSADGLRDLQRLAAYETALTVGRDKLDLQLLPTALARLPHPEASRWSRLRSSLRGGFQRAPARPQESWSSQFLVRLRTGTSGMDVLVYAALAGSMLLAGLTVAREWRRARVTRHASSRTGTAPGVASASAASAPTASPLDAGVHPDRVAARSWRDRPREVLEQLLAQLVQRRQLPPSGALTVRELIQLARLPEAERERLAKLAGTAELLRFAAVAPAPEVVERSIVEAESLLQHLRSSEAGQGYVLDPAAPRDARAARASRSS